MYLGQYIYFDWSKGDHMAVRAIQTQFEEIKEEGKRPIQFSDAIISNRKSTHVSGENNITSLQPQVKMV